MLCISLFAWLLLPPPCDGSSDGCGRGLMSHPDRFLHSAVHTEKDKLFLIISIWVVIIFLLLLCMFVFLFVKFWILNGNHLPEGFVTGPARQLKSCRRSLVNHDNAHFLTWNDDGVWAACIFDYFTSVVLLCNVSFLFRIVSGPLLTPIHIDGCAIIKCSICLFIFFSFSQTIDVPLLT